MHYVSDLGDMQTDYRPPYTVHIPWTLHCVTTLVPVQAVYSVNTGRQWTPIQIHFILKADMELNNLASHQI
jgi:hypothetical protein